MTGCNYQVTPRKSLTEERTRCKIKLHIYKLMWRDPIRSAFNSNHGLICSAWQVQDNMPPIPGLRVGILVVSRHLNKNLGEMVWKAELNCLGLWAIPTMITKRALTKLISTAILILSSAPTLAIHGAKNRRDSPQSTNVLGPVAEIKIVNKIIAPDGFNRS